MTAHDRRVRIPADVDRPDPILANLTARQVGILTAAAVFGWVLTRVAATFVAFPWNLTVAAPCLMAGAVLALGRRDGLTADRYVAAALAHARGPRRLVAAGQWKDSPPRWARHNDSPPTGPLPLPVCALTEDAVLEVGNGSAALLCEVQAVSLALTSAEERGALVAAFGRWLNALPALVQVVVRSEAVDLSATVAQLEAAAADLPHPALTVAARKHAAFLAGLADHHGLLRRQVLLVLTEPGHARAAAPTLLRRAEQARDHLATAGVQLRILSRGEAATVLAAATGAPAPVDPDNRAIDVVHGA